MNETSTRVIALRVAAAIAVFASCDPGSHTLGEIPATGGGVGHVEPAGGASGAGGGTGTTGGGVATTGGGAGMIDAGAPCECAVSDFTMTVSWACFHEHFFYDRQLQQTCGDVELSMACDLTVIKFHGPQSTSVRDATGATVGQEAVSDTLDYVCPDNPSLHAFIVRAGTFPDAGCSTTVCSCADGGVSCP